MKPESIPNKDIFLYFDAHSCKMHQTELEGVYNYYNRIIFKNILSWDEEYEREASRLDYLFSRNYDPDNDDPASIGEHIHELATEHAISAAEINSYLIGMAIVSLYHLWERQIIRFIERELSHYNATDKVNINKFSDIVDIFKRFSTPPDILPQHNSLNELRLIANTIKHGSGKSLNDIVSMNLDILTETECTIPLLGGEHSLLMTALYPRVEHFNRYFQATHAFWDQPTWNALGERRFYSPT